MNRLLAGCCGILSIAACTDATAPSPTQPAVARVSAPVAAATGDLVPGHYIVVLRSGASSSEALVRRHSLSKALLMDQHFGTVMHGFSAAVSDADADSLRSDPAVESVVQDRYVHQLGTETGMGWALDRVDQHLLPLSGSFAYGATGAGVNIYVIDGGIRYTHVEFGGRAHFAYDAFGGNGSDCNGHGTGVAGVAAGSVHGVAKAATIWSVRVFPCSGTTTLSTILAGVDWVTANHRSPAVANMSMGAAAAPILDTAVARSIRSGVTYVSAAGNNGGDACAMSPGKLSTIINVGASASTDERPSWSNYGSCVSMFAPGASVPSTDYFSDVATATWNGTSLAAPFVSGAVALYLQLHPTASPATIRSAFLTNATLSKLTNLAGSANRLIYTGFVGSTTTTTTSTATPTTTTTTTTTAAPTPTTIASVAGVGVSYKCVTQVCGFNAGSSAPSGGVSSYSWKFGDGSTATGRTAAHTYPKTYSSYTFSLVITTSTGVKYTATKSITPASASGSATSTTKSYVPPATTTTSTSTTFAPNFTASCTKLHVCTYNASSSTVPNGVSSYNWTLGDGYHGSYVIIGHSYSGPKTVSVTLKIWDKKYISKSITKTITVP